MASKSDTRTVGRSVGLSGGALVLVGGIGALLSVGLTVRPSDIHSEYVKYLSGKDTITAYLAYPERRDPAPGVIVIHDIYGMSDRLRPASVRCRGRTPSNDSAGRRRWSPKSSG